MAVLALAVVKYKLVDPSDKLSVSAVVISPVISTSPVTEIPEFVVSNFLLLLWYKSWEPPELNTADVLLPAALLTVNVPDLNLSEPVPASSI